VTKVTKRASICLIHDKARSSDVFIELSLHLALNGFVVYMIDLEGSGYSAGNRINNLTVEKFHYQVATCLMQVSPDLPCYMLGHGVGALAINTFLGRNPKLASRVAGVFYCAPMFGSPDKFSVLDKLRIFLQSSFMDEIILMEKMPIQKHCRNKEFIR